MSEVYKFDIPYHHSHPLRTLGPSFGLSPGRSKWLQCKLERNMRIRRVGTHGNRMCVSPKLSSHSVQDTTNAPMISTIVLFHSSLSLLSEPSPCVSEYLTAVSRVLHVSRGKKKFQESKEMQDQGKENMKIQQCICQDLGSDPRNPADQT